MGNTSTDDLTRLADDDDDRTRLRSDTSAAPARTPSSPPSSSGWLSGSGAIDHGRFPPGTLLGGRYRVVGRLGRGGMGEVYRADDLKLGQPVALKFLPPDVDRDPARLTQLHTEVRMARQVSHPNVCRVYDIDEIDGQTFLSMEYIDGEDLGQLLRRIGRFPEERALAIARQICAGLAAAHDRGVVHRDFKPANVMIDGAGKIRITDFGLAGVAGEAVRAGTPAYMAPEQLAGGEVTARSDIYALGLVLYELFTGQRALDGKNLAEIIHKREQVGIVPPSHLVRDLNPQIEAAILRCLRPDASARPASALSVAAALPGGDPLAAALAAGETPSPDMVAAAGGEEMVATRRIVLTAAWVVISLAALIVLYQRSMLINRVAVPKTPDALQDRAVEALARLGYSAPPGDTARGLGFSYDYARYIAANFSDANRWRRLDTTRPETFYLWYRTSPRALVPFGFTETVNGANPPLTVAGMTLTIVDGSGRVSEFLAVPEPTPSGSPRPSTDWKAVFDVTGLAMATLTPIVPQSVPPVFADERAAWEGRLPEFPDYVVRVEAAAFAGHVVSILVTGPWTHSVGSAPVRPPLFNRVLEIVQAVVMPALMLAAALLARRNVKAGRGDRRGAFRTATVMFVALMVGWLPGGLLGHAGVDIDRGFAAIGRALFDAALLWLTYLGLEPYIRRYSPDSLIGWTRLIAGRWHDPRVASDVMIGVSAGLAMTVLYGVHNVIPPLVGRPEPTPLWMNPNLLLDTRHVLAYLLNRSAGALQGAMLCVVGVVALRIWLKRPWLVALAAIACFTPVGINGMFQPGTPVLDLVLGTLLMTTFVVTILRFGLLATTAALATHFILLRAPLTTDFSSWRASLEWWFVGAVALAGLGACYTAYQATAKPEPRYAPMEV